MTTFRESAVDEATAHNLLASYFAERAQTFPEAQGSYRTTFPAPEQFVAPEGVFLVVVDDDDTAIGCGGIRRLPQAAPSGLRRLVEQTVDGATTLRAPEAETVQNAERVRFEVKHLWLSPAARGRGLGRALLTELERRAAAFGASEVVLDTNDSLEAAGGLYRASGYESIAPYNDNPNATTWYRKSL
ncbi:GNAT family N-acetyltransferase [Microbacterium sp. STN6]|uniref:GNAT family N-acetyltransferase n=1 Tax=Microbacterium sp. STN6 TaxID=2995588 RepID=UPI002260E7B2|nr:GNAT family N-acetyltransferase [Microbacterium sp. STN6]MCX7521295.1 GNAT family N-acetyltransferase [Microbacterium sp. STN6]